MRLCIFTFVTTVLEGCCDHECRMEKYMEAFGGGGQDAITVDLPFTEGYDTRCVQGAGGNYSHSYTSTLYDADFDTPNTEDVPVYAPIGGVAYVHDADRENGFGVHVNIDQGDGTYVILAHLDDVFIDDGSEVAAGQMLGFEGTTGSSTGDHVHIGRHAGNAEDDGALGTSVEGLVFRTSDGDIPVTSLNCDITTGTVYRSLLATPLWHPNGTLVKTPSEPAVYLLENDTRRPFIDEASFLSRGYSFADVALIDEDELGCYGLGDVIYGEGTDETEGTFFAGALISEVSSSSVYAIADNVAMPIETWETYLLLGFENRTVLELADGAIDDEGIAVGDCGVNMYCISRDDVLRCGGPDEEDEGSFGGVDDGEEAESASLNLTWTMPSGATAERITLSGEYVHAAGWSDGWQMLAEATNASSIGYAVDAPANGDTLRFSVEFVSGGVTTWSCLAPYPPGTVQGSAVATVDGNSVAVVTADDPTSDGCGLILTVP